MGIFRKAKTFISGLYAKTVENTEKNQPAALIAETEDRIEKGKRRAAEQLTEIRSLSETVRAGMKEKERALLEIKDAISLAASERNKERLVELIIEEEHAENAYMSHKKLYDSAVCDAIKIRDGYRLFESEMREKLQELKTLRTQAQRIKMREQILLLDSRYASAAEKEEDIEALRNAVHEKCTLASHSAAEQADIISRNISRKRAMEKAEALLMVGNEFDTVQESG